MTIKDTEYTVAQVFLAVHDGDEDKLLLVRAFICASPLLSFL